MQYDQSAKRLHLFIKDLYVLDVDISEDEVEHVMSHCANY